VDAPEEAKKEARKKQKTRFIRSAPAKQKRANIWKQLFIHREPFLMSRRNIENLPDFVNREKFRSTIPALSRVSISPFESRGAKPPATFSFLFKRQLRSQDW
jgi:hypothetical protein